MKKKVTLIAVICVLTMLSCSIPKSIKESFTYCYDDKYTGIDTLINIDGYYKELHIDERSSMVVNGILKDTSIIDTSYYHFMFYSNGMIVYGLTDFNDKRHENKRIKKNIPLFLKEISENSKTPGANYFYGNDWGSYAICGDTIKIQKIHKWTSLNDDWSGGEEWYKIIDKNTIQCIRSFNLPITLPYNSQPEKRRNPATFVPIPAKPKPDKSWILKEKWFWCNENDWRTYMERLKKDEEKKK